MVDRQKERTITLPFQERAEDDFVFFARSLEIPPGGLILEDAMLAYEKEGTEPFQRNFFEDVAPSLHAVRDGIDPSVRRFWMERTKKGGKDSDLAVVVLWLMAFARRPVFCQIVAASREQAAIIKKRAEDVLHYNDWLQEFVEIQQSRILSKNRMGETKIEPTDKTTGHGGTPDLLILNELVHVTKWEAMETHYNNAAGVPRGVMIVSTNAGYKGTKAEQWKKNALANPKRWHVHVWNELAPWLRKDDVEDARRINSVSEYNRLFGGRWVSGKGDAVTEEAIDRVFRPGLSPMTGDEEGWTFVAGLDLGVSHDHAGLTVLGANRAMRRMRVAFLRDWPPTVENDKGVKEVDIAKIKRTLRGVHKRYRLLWFGYDPAAGGSFLAQEMRAEGVRMSEMRFEGGSLNEMAVAFMQVLKAGCLESFENESLRRDFGKFHLESKPLSGYRLRAVSDEFGHADVGTALVICLPKAVELLGGVIEGQYDVLMSEGDDLTEEEQEQLDPLLRDIVEDLDEMDGDRILREAARNKRMGYIADPFADFF